MRMKHLLILATFVFITAGSEAVAGHSRGNGTCTDDITHWANMINKRSDAPLWEYSKRMQSEAVGYRVTGDQERCEEYMEEALRAIRKPYPTE